MDADLGFMARLLALCSLPRTDPKNRLQYVRRNGPYTLGISAGVGDKLPYGNIPRLLLAWVCTHRVRGLEGEARLESYERLHWAAGEVDEGLFRKVLLGISCRDYEAAVEAVPGDRAVEVDGVAGVQEGDRQAAEGVSGT